MISERGNACIRLQLRVRNFGENPDVVTDTLGLIPTFAGKRGDRALLSNGLTSRRKLFEPEWFINGRISKQAPLDAHFAEIANVARRCDTFHKLPMGAQVEVVATIIWGYRNPSISVSAVLMAEFARIGARLVYKRVMHKRGVGSL